MADETWLVKRLDDGSFELRKGDLVIIHGSDEWHALPEETREEIMKTIMQMITEEPDEIIEDISDEPIEDPYDDDSKKKRGARRIPGWANLDFDSMGSAEEYFDYGNPDRQFTWSDYRRNMTDQEIGNMWNANDKNQWWANFFAEKTGQQAPASPPSDNDNRDREAEDFATPPKQDGIPGGAMDEVRRRMNKLLAGMQGGTI